MTDNNTPKNNNSRELLPSPVPTSLATLKPEVEEISTSVFKIINYKNTNLKAIEIHDMIIVYSAIPWRVTVFWKVDKEIWASETVLPIKLLWSELINKFRTEINNEICESHKSPISNLPIVFYWPEWLSYNLNEFFISFPQERKEVKKLLQDIKDEFYYVSTISFPDDTSNVIFFDRDYMEEWIDIIKIWEAEYVYKLLGDSLKVKAKVYSHWPDGSVVWEYLLPEEIDSSLWNIAKAIIKSEWKTIEDINITYDSRPEKALKNDTNDTFFIEEGISIFDDQVYIQNFSEKHMKIYNYAGREYVYRLIWTTMYFYGKIKDSVDDHYTINTFERTNDIRFLESLISKILKKEWIIKVDIAVLFKAAGCSDFAYITDKEHMWNALWEWLSTNKTTLN